MAGRIDYQIEKFQFIERNESPRITRQWAEVIAECQQEKANSETRLRTALLNVDYATSFELPFRLLLIRAPQLVDRLRSPQRELLCFRFFGWKMHCTQMGNCHTPT